MLYAFIYDCTNVGFPVIVYIDAGGFGGMHIHYIHQSYTALKQVNN
jgi:hypothetical protein